MKVTTFSRQDESNEHKCMMVIENGFMHVNLDEEYVVINVGGNAHHFCLRKAIQELDTSTDKTKESAFAKAWRKGPRHSGIVSSKYETESESEEESEEESEDKSEDETEEEEEKPEDYIYKRLFMIDQTLDKLKKDIEELKMKQARKEYLREKRKHLLQ